MKIVPASRQLIKLCFVLLISCSLALSASPMTSANASLGMRGSASPSLVAVDYPVVGFHLSGRFLYDANENNFVMRGINHPHAWFPMQTNSFANIKAKGANTVRVVLSNGKRWTRNSATDVANVINLCKANKLICVLEVHDTTGYKDDGDLADPAASLAAAVSYWKSIKSVLVEQEAYIVINLGNEPYGSLNVANWTNATKNAITEMRNAGFQHTLMVDAPDWGQDDNSVMLNNAASILASDPAHDILFSIHMFERFNTADKIESYLSSFVTAGLPLVIGEFGPVHNGIIIPLDAIMEKAQKYGIGYIGWSWSGNNSSNQGLDIVTNFNPNLETAWGTRLIHGANGIIPTSVPCSVYNGNDNILVRIANWGQGFYSVPKNQNRRVKYLGLNNGPVKVTSSNNIPLVASERVAYSPDGGTTWTGYSELMGLPANQVTTSYTFPWYNNVDLNSQFRFANIGNASTTVTVIIAGQPRGTYPLLPGQSTRASYIGVNDGPVVVQSSGGVSIIASERVAYFDGSAWTSFSELMGLPSNKLTTSYTFPWYNNVNLNSQLRFGNVGTANTNVTVTIGGVWRGTYPLGPSESLRVSYPALDQGPVVVTSSGGVKIIASMRVAYFDSGPGKWTDFSEMMGMPNPSLSTSYSFPVYNNLDLNTQLRFGNVGNVPTTITVTIGGVVKGTFNLAPNASQRVSYPVNGGPVVISSSGGVKIIASERVAYFNGTAWTSFAEWLGLPKEQLDTTYFLPWYNNVDLDTQLRFGVP